MSLMEEKRRAVAIVRNFANFRNRIGDQRIYSFELLRV
jgi:hypothetical protein